MRIFATTLFAALAATGANAATFLLDDFNSAQAVQDVGPPPSSQVADTAVLGGFRDLQAISDSGTAGSIGLVVNGGGLSLRNFSDTAGIGLVTYDGDDDPTTVNTTGLGGFDLTFGGVGTGLLFANMISSGPLLIGVNIWDVRGGFSTFSESIHFPASSPFKASFGDLIGDADLTNIGAFQVTLGGDGTLGVNARLTAISVAAVPVPAAGLLLGGVLIGGVAASRRRRRKAA